MINRRSSRRHASSRSFSLLSFLKRGREKRVRRRQYSEAFEVAEFGTSSELLEDRTLLTHAIPLWVAQGPTPIINGQVENVPSTGAGANPVIGAIHDVALHPTNSNVAFLGTVNGGVWRSTDFTAANPTYTPLTDHFAGTSIGALEFDPTDATNNTLYAGIGHFSSFGRTGTPLTGLLRTTDGGNTWTQLGNNNAPPVIPGPAGGLRGVNISGVVARGNTIVVAANNFGGGTGPGVYRSTNGGTSFNLISGINMLGVGPAFDLVEDPTNANRMYVSIGGVGVFFSPDQGLNWNNISSGDMSLNANITGGGNNNTEMAVSPTTGRIYAGVVVNGQPRYVGFSDNQGGMWNEMDLPITLEGAFPITAASNTMPIVITSAFHGLGPNDRVRVQGVLGNAAANGDFFVTVLNQNQFQLNGSVGNGAYAGGGTFRELSGLSPKVKPGGQGAIHFSIVVDPNNANIVYIGGDRQDFPFPNAIGANDFSGRLFRGNTAVAAVAPGSLSNVASPQWAHITHTQNAGFAGGGTANNTSPHADSRDMAFRADGTLIEVDDGGIYGRTNPQNNTGDWFSLISDVGGGLQVTEIHDIAYDNNSNVIISGHQDTGTAQQIAAGSLTYTSVPLVPPLFGINFSNADGGDVAVDNLIGAGQSLRYSSIQNLGLFRRQVYDAAGTLVTQTVPTLTGPGITAQFVTPLAVNEVAANRLVIGGSNGVFESLNRGDNVALVSPAPVFATPVPAGFTRVAVTDSLDYGAAANSEFLYAGFRIFDVMAGAPAIFRNFGVFGRSAAGVMTQRTAPTGASNLIGIEMDSTNGNTVYTIDSNQIWRSLDGGNNWTEITGNLGDNNLKTIQFIANPGGDDVILVGGEGGVFRTTISTLGTWSEFGMGLPNSIVHDMDYDAVDDILLVGTLGRGAWAIEDVSATIFQSDDPFELNNTQSTATVLGSLPKVTLRDLSIEGLPDVDYFKYTASDTGKLIVNMFFDGTTDNIDLRVLDVNGNAIATGTQSNIRPGLDGEGLVIPVVSQEEYWIEVSTNLPNVVGYDLEIENFQAPTPTGIILNPAADSGMMNNDNVTTANSPGFFVTVGLDEFQDMGIPIDVAPGADVRLQAHRIGGGFDDKSLTPLDPLNPAVWSGNLSLSEGVWIVTAYTRITDGTGATGDAELSSPLLVTIDNTPPLALNAPTLLTSSDTGMLNNDMVTNKMSPAFFGSAEPNTKVRISANGLLVGQGVVNSDGLWEVTVEPLADGQYDIQVSFEDAAGNLSAASPTKQIWIDTEAPNTPLLDLTTDTGRHDADNITNDSTPDFDFTVNDTPDGGLNPFPNDLKYRLYLRPGDGSGEILVYDSWTANANSFVAGGSFSHTIGAALNDGTVAIADGVYDFKLEVEDRAGNIGHDFLLNVTIDTTAPPKQFGDGVDDGLHPDSDTGIVGQPGLSVDRITSDTTPQITGLAEADSIIRLYVVTGGGNVLIGQTVATPLDGNHAFANGEWSITSNIDLNDPTLGLTVDGIRNLRITAEDVAGNLSMEMDFQIFTDTVGPRVVNVFSSVDPAYNLFAPKPVDGPTPLMQSIDISLSDLPARVAADFLYAAANPTLASEIGNYSLVGDSVGNVAITSINFLDVTTDGNPGDTTVRLNFAQPLEDDRYTLTISDDISDNAGNALDGESNAVGNTGAPSFSSGDGTPGGDFVARFTVDTRPEIGTWGQSGIFIDANQTFGWESPNALNPNYDISTDLTFNIGLQSDTVFAGQFKPAGAATVNGYDRLGVYGHTNGRFRFYLDFNDNGLIEAGEGFVSNIQANALPVAGNFDGNAANGDEIGLFDSKFWYLDTTGDNQLDTVIPTAVYGLPFVGDFDGDGLFDLAGHVSSSNQFFFDFGADGYGGLVDDSLAFGLPGISERPFAADFDQDGIDDIGLTSKNQSGVLGESTLEWYVFRSGGVNAADVPGVLPARLKDGFSPTPLGNDLYTTFGANIAAPVVGNFDPPAPTPEPLALVGPGDTTTDTSPTTTWNIAGGATGYEVLFYDSSAGQLLEHSTDLGVLDTTFTHDEELTVGGSYQIWVRPIDLDGQPGEWASPVNFEVVDEPLAAPTLTGPSGSGPSGAVTVSWAGSDNATGYDVLIYNTITGQEADSEYGVNGTTHDTALGAGSYRTYARATNATQTSSWSAYMEFELTGSSLALSVPTGFAASPNAGGSVKFSWTASSAADHELLIYNTVTGQEVARLPGLTGESKTLSLPNSNFQALLRATDGAGTVTGWTSIRFDVTTASASSVLTLTPFTGPVTAGAVTLSWTGDSSATYELLVYNKTTGQEHDHVLAATGGSDTSTVNYVAGFTYQVYIREVGGTGGWATPLEFDVVSVDELINNTNNIETVLPQADTQVAGNVEAPIHLADAVFTALEANANDAVVIAPVAKEVAEVSVNENANETDQLDSVLAGWGELEWWNEGNVNLAETTDVEGETDASLVIAAAAFGVATPIIRDSRKRTPKAHLQQRLQ